ncbi:sensor histidine kinase [Roseivirga pacifica]|uniref:sensor histidine kinase n=1 Tax=Roseivirga pacifica TaxID=1267423 RepID=UPI003BAE25FA
MKNLIPISIVVSIFLFAVAIGIILQVNQGHYFVEAAVKDGYAEIDARQLYINTNIAKSISAALLLVLFFVGARTTKRLFQVGQLKFALPIFLLYLMFYSSVCTMTHELLNTSFSFSILKSQAPTYVPAQAIISAIYYSIIGLAGLLASTTYTIIKCSKKVKGISLKALGSKFRAINFSSNFTLFLVIYIIRNPNFSISFGTIGLLTSMVIFSILSSKAGSLVLISFLSKGQLTFSKPIERISQAILSSFGIYSVGFLLFVLSFSFDSAFFSALETFPSTILLLFIIIVIAGLIAIALWKYNIAGVRTEAALNTAKSELSFLKSQINPHFLFNSLNSIYGIALAEKSPKTADGVQKLSDMMRFMLKENTQEKISLNKEIEYIHNYIDLQSLRLDTNKHVQLNVSIEQPCDGNISPMLLIPMIENAFKHGVSIDKPSFIDIALKCNEHYVSLNVKNSNHHKEKTSAEESGIGLENVRKRLELLYPEKHLFQVYENEETYEAFIKIELA